MTDAERWMVIGARRWRRTDPSLPTELVDALKSHLGRGRSGVRSAKLRDDEGGVVMARRRVDLAKHGLGERGPAWWDDDGAARLRRAHEALTKPADLDGER
ncbi:hypothetical protein [Aeromicrobium sp.]|uniref:hypothetical protein n=1 Tax=Aeromicrobium sp. TaxID=1871063 RepID=UPI0025C35053|nr:hypothetical protein [Aeromicrobium sp.]